MGLKPEMNHLPQMGVYSSRVLDLAITFVNESVSWHHSRRSYPVSLCIRTQPRRVVRVEGTVCDIDTDSVVSVDSTSIVFEPIPVN